MEKLEKLCQDVVLDGVADGIYKNMALDTRMSNYLFKRFTEEHSFTEDVVHGFKEWHVSKFVVSDMVTPVYGNFIGNSNSIETLDVPLKLLEKKYGSVVLAIRKLLNQSSQNSLRKLSLHGTHQYRINWNNMPPLPNLQYLNVSGCKINAFEEPKIVKLFPNLRELDISNSGLTSFKSIGELKDLEVLNIQDLHITEGLEELFKLLKLKVLIMSSSEYINIETAKIYAEHQKGLPELRLLDISFSSVTRELIEPLLENHPKLEILNLIGTEQELYYTPTTSRTQVLTIKTLESCVKALQFVIKNECPRRASNIFTYRILNRIGDIRRNADGLSEESIRKTGLELVSVMERNRNSKKIVERSMVALYYLLEQYSRIFTEEEIESIVTSILTFHQAKIDHHNANSFLWYIISKQLILNQLNVKTIDKICLVGAESPGDTYLVLRTMCYCLPKTSDECRLKLSNACDFKYRILDALKDAKVSFHKHTILEVMSKLSSYVKEENLQLSRRHIEVMLREIEDNAHNNVYRYILFKNLRSMVEKMDPRVFESFFTEEHLKILRRMMCYHPVILRDETVHLLTLIVECSGKLPHFDEDHEEKQRQIVEFYDNQNRFPFSLTSFFRNLKNWEKYKYPKHFADIILDYIYDQEKIEGPSAKIKKLIVSK